MIIGKFFWFLKIYDCMVCIGYICRMVLVENEYIIMYGFVLGNYNIFLVNFLFCYVLIF